MSQEVVCHRVKLRPGSLKRVREWSHIICERREEALATLRDEGVTIESAFLEETAGGPYFIYYMRGPRLKLGAAASSSHSIDEYHQMSKADTWEAVPQLELLIDLDRSAE